MGCSNSKTKAPESPKKAAAAAPKKEGTPKAAAAAKPAAEEKPETPLHDAPEVAPTETTPVATAAPAAVEAAHEVTAAEPAKEEEEVAAKNDEAPADGAKELRAPAAAEAKPDEHVVTAPAEEEEEPAATTAAATTAEELQSLKAAPLHQESQTQRSKDPNSLYAGPGPSEEFPIDNIYRCFDEGNGLLFRLVNKRRHLWAFYNDTQEYVMRVAVTFGPESSIKALDDTRATDVSEATGECRLVLDIHPGETKKFMRGEYNGFTISYDANPIDSAAAAEEQAEAETAEAVEAAEVAAVLEVPRPEKELEAPREEPEEQAEKEAVSTERAAATLTAQKDAVLDEILAEEDEARRTGTHAREVDPAKEAETEAAVAAIVATPVPTKPAVDNKDGL